jgi:hypothetical protein
MKIVNNPKPNHNPNPKNMNKISLVLLMAALTQSASAALVFQADFNGEGSGTGGASDLVTTGGTGTLRNGFSEALNVDASIGSSTPLVSGAGSYLSLNDSGTENTPRSGGVDFTPSSSANSFDSWYVDNGTSGFDTLNGSFDFFFRTTLVTNSIRFLDVSGISNEDPNGLRMMVYMVDEIIQVQLFGAVNTRAFGSVSLTANTPYHFASTISTDGSGIITTKLFLATGNTMIDTNASTHLFATISGDAIDAGASNSHTESFNSAGGFTFGHHRNEDPDEKTFDLDSFRIYDSAVSEFTAIPEPAVMSLLSGSFVLLAVFGTRRTRKSLKS